MIPDTTGWLHFGKSSNADFYEVEPELLAIVPFDQARDDASSARESIKLQLDHLKAKRSRAGVVVFMDRLVEQDAGARAVYRDAPDPEHQACFALVGGTPFGRAVASIFIGLSPPKVPTKLFPNYEAAVAWIRASIAGR